MTIYASTDAGRTWPISRIIDPRPCRYSDLAVTPDGTVLCLYSVGNVRDLEKITLGRVHLDQLIA